MAIAGDVTWFGDSAGTAPSRAAVRAMRLYFVALALVGLAALILGIENRIAPTGAFLFAPPVDLVPPLSPSAWFAAFAAHQQDPVFVACGGTESLDQFKALYWWEWLRQASLVALAGAVAIGLAAALLRYRFALRWFVGPSLVVLGYFLAGAAFELAASNVDTLIRYNVGQYRHALGLTFASLAIALTLATGLDRASLRVSARPRLGRRGPRCGWRRDRGAVCGAQCCGGVAELSRLRGAALPPLDRLGGYTPLWLNLTFNPYAIQLEHRFVAFSCGAWCSLLSSSPCSEERAPGEPCRAVPHSHRANGERDRDARPRRAGRACARPRVGGVVVLAGFFYLLFPAGRDLTRPVTSNCH